VGRGGLVQGDRQAERGALPHVRVGIIEEAHQQRHAPLLAGLLAQRSGDRLPNPAIRVGATGRGMGDEQLQRRRMVQRGDAERDVALLARGCVLVLIRARMSSIA
jgi:hypothetical protein